MLTKYRIIRSESEITKNEQRPDCWPEDAELKWRTSYPEGAIYMIERRSVWTLWRWSRITFDDFSQSWFTLKAAQDYIHNLISPGKGWTETVIPFNPAT